ncbi:hypothetical protein [Streptomyces sp. NPDC002758]
MVERIYAGQEGAIQSVRDIIYLFPIYTGQTIPYADWPARMWLDTWT